MTDEEMDALRAGKFRIVDLEPSYSDEDRREIEHLQKLAGEVHRRHVREMDVLRRRLAEIVARYPHRSVIVPR